MDKPSVPGAQNPASSAKGVCGKERSWVGQLLHQRSLCWIVRGSEFTGSSLDCSRPSQQTVLPGRILFFKIYKHFYFLSHRNLVHVSCLLSTLITCIQSTVQYSTLFSSIIPLSCSSSHCTLQFIYLYIFFQSINQSLHSWQFVNRSCKWSLPRMLWGVRWSYWGQRQCSWCFHSWLG